MKNAGLKKVNKFLESKKLGKVLLAYSQRNRNDLNEYNVYQYCLTGNTKFSEFEALGRYRIVMEENLLDLFSDDLSETDLESLKDCFQYN